ncbi:G8 domain-containing protein [Deinococcus sonorensis]|uniref:G8 domain-containing protein n=2 Tax=Deinococcus sonorensis TaxID=309891 RepID=A0AAU7UCE3_9DEIO
MKPTFMPPLLLLSLVLAACGGAASGPAPAGPGTSVGVATPSTPAAPLPTPTLRWSDPASWPNRHVPLEGDSVTVPEGQAMLLDVSPPALRSLTVPAGSALMFADQDLTLRTDWILLHGTLAVGSEARPYVHRAVIELTDTVPDENVMGMGDRLIGVMGGRLDLHGEARTSWTRLAQTARTGSTTLTVQDAPDWRPGDLLALATTDFDSAQTETVAVRSVQGRVVTLAQPLRFTHWGTPEQIGGQTVTEQAEVGLLSRNITVQAAEDSVTSGLGGQVMVMSGSTAHLEGVEFTRMGQRNTLRRYPVHFHMLGSAAGSYLRGSSLHDLYNRCVTVHGTSDLSIQQNVAYNTVGHCYFMEDGAETGNIFSSNLALLVRRPDTRLHETPLLSSDRNPAGFWITNPANSYVGNVAAGVQGTGFWYAMPEHPTGLSQAAGGTLWPRRTPLGQFQNNVAHGTDTGLNVDNGNAADGTTTETMLYTPVVTPSDRASTPVEAAFTGFTGYKNRQRGVWLRGSHLRLSGGTLADNAVGATLAANQAAVDGTLLVGETANLGTPQSWEATGEGGRSLPRPWDAGFPIRGFEFYDGTVSLERASLARFVPNSLRPASGLGYNRQNSFALSPLNSASGLHWLDSSNRVWLDTPLMDRDGDKAATFIDRDGSVTGTAGRSVVATSPLLTPGCVRQDAWNASVCTGAFGQLGVQAVSGETVGTLGVSGVGGTLSLVGQPSDRRYYATTLPEGGRYTLTLPVTPAHLRLNFGYVRPGQTLRLDLPYTGTPAVYRDWWVDARNQLTQVPLSQLETAQGDRYALENGVLSVRLVVQAGRDYAELEVCRTALCP